MNVCSGRIPPPILIGWIAPLALMVIPNSQYSIYSTNKRLLLLLAGIFSVPCSWQKNLNLSQLFSSIGYLLIKNPPDFETKKQYDLLIEAADNGNPALSATAPVKVIIEDVNDHSPIFNQSNYSWTVSEGTAVRGRVGAVYATDRDSGPRGRIVYSITGRNVGSVFTIDGNTGQYYLKNKVSNLLQHSITVEPR